MRLTKAVFIFFLPLVIPLYTYCQHCDSIPWSSKHELKWRYFKGRPDKNSVADALSEPHIYYHLSCTSSLASFTFSCSFPTCKAWVKRATSHNLLEHEQTHFDLAEYYKRLMVKEILSQRFSAGNIVEKVQTIANLIDRLRRETNELYDLETEHSANEGNQKEWSKKVRKMVKKLGDFDKANYIVTLY